VMRRKAWIRESLWQDPRKSREMGTELERPLNQILGEGAFLHHILRKRKLPYIVQHVSIILPIILFHFVNPHIVCESLLPSSSSYCVADCMMIGSSGFAGCPIQIADLEAHRQIDTSNTRTHMHAKGRLAKILSFDDATARLHGIFEGCYDDKKRP
jgi:hypothetical protein